MSGSSCYFNSASLPASSAQRERLATTLQGSNTLGRALPGLSSATMLQALLYGLLLHDLRKSILSLSLLQSILAPILAECRSLLPSDSLLVVTSRSQIPGPGFQGGRQPWGMHCADDPMHTAAQNVKAHQHGFMPLQYWQHMR